MIGIGIILVFAGATLSLALSATQSIINAKIGSDHSVHAFLIDGIRRNKFKLFVTIPRLLNTCHCAALPLYIHRCLAYFSGTTVYWSERLLNPIMNSLHVFIFALIAFIASRQVGLSAAWIGMASCVFAMTPQFFHSLSARNFGISARGTGLLLLTLYFLSAWGTEAHLHVHLWWIALTGISCLIWCFSTFGAQALCLISLLLLVITGRWVPIAGTLIGLGLFIAIHPRYSLSYLRSTLRFIYTYATELAPVYILKRRESIWRDLVWDIWKGFGEGFRSGFRYAYENSVFVVLVLNPMVLLVCISSIWINKPTAGLFAFGHDVAISGSLAFILTSFRPTRFLGEPERYVEAVTPWVILYGSFILKTRFGLDSLIVVVLLYIIINLLQIYATKILVRYIAANHPDLSEIMAAANQRLGNNVKFSSNNEHWTKMLLRNDWNFAYCLAAGQDYAGLKMPEVFSTFPMVKQDACDRIVARYRVNACLLDRTLYENLFESTQRPPTLLNISIAYDSARFRLLILDWADASNPIGALE